LTYHVCPADEATTVSLADPTVLVAMDATVLVAVGSTALVVVASTVLLADPTVLVAELDATAIRSDSRGLELLDVSVTG